MNLVDSSGWLEYFANGKNADFFAPIIEDTQNLVVSTINIYEVYKRILQQTSENMAIEAISAMRQAHTIDVSSGLALFAARLSQQLKLPMADSIILATARTMHCILWTQDSDFERIKGVKYIKK